MTNNNIQGKVVVITGASSVLGEATARYIRTTVISPGAVATEAARLHHRAWT